MRGGMGGPYRGRGGRGGFRGPRIIRRDRRDFNDFPPILNIPERSASPVDTRFLRYLHKICTYIYCILFLILLNH